MNRKKPAPSPAPVAAPQPRRVLVAYAYDDAGGYQRHDRLWIDGLADLRTLEELLKTEQLIAAQRGLQNVRVLSWKGLEA
jgi:hypothetical protein